MLKDEHKHWKVKTVTALPHSVYKLYMYKRSDKWLACELRLMSLVWIGGKILATAIHEPAGSRIRHQNLSRIRTSQSASRQMSDGKALIWNSILWLLWIQRTKHGPEVHGPPLWTVPWIPCHGPGPWILFYFYRKVLDRVHGHFFK